MQIGILPLARNTFDVEFAEQNLTQMLAKLSAGGHSIVGSKQLLFDEAAAKQALAELQSQNIEHLLLLQVTFTDASMTVAAANYAAAANVPLSIWAVPEPRLGGRLRLNAFCGLNLASHALGLNGRGYSWLYADPAAADGQVEADLQMLFAGERRAGQLQAAAGDNADGGALTARGKALAASIRGKRIARIGEHPVGFDTCAYEAEAVESLSGVQVDAMRLEELFAEARAASEADAAVARATAEADLCGLDEVDQAQLTRSLRLKTGLDALRARGNYDAFAVRCWPEMFTEYGGAFCGPAAMMGEARVPCACEADVYGALSQMILQAAADAPVCLSDLVDVDVGDDTAVVWHCGQAPVSMRAEGDGDSAARATVHTNRKMPLLYEFALKPGAVTFLRVSKAFNRPKMVLGFGEMLARPMAFTGTSGVVRFARGSKAVLHDILDAGLEHHMAFAYGDHRAILRETAAAMGLAVLEI